MTDFLSFSLLKAVWRAIGRAHLFFRGEAYLSKERHFDVEIRAGVDHRQPYETQFKDIPVPQIRLLAGRIEWDPVVYAHDHFVIRTRHGTWEGFGTGQARLGYTVQGVTAAGWRKVIRKLWPPSRRILVEAAAPIGIESAQSRLHKSTSRT